MPLLFCSREEDLPAQQSARPGKKVSAAPRGEGLNPQKDLHTRQKVVY